MRRAHTLMELLVVLTLLSLIAAIAAPRLVNGMSRPRVLGARAALRSDLEFTRARTVATGLRHQMHLDPSTGQVTVHAYHPDEATDTAASSQPDVVLSDRLPPEVTITWEPQIGLGSAAAAGSASATNSTITDVVTFYPEGTGDGLLATFEDRKGARCGLELDGFTGEIRDLTETDLQNR